MVSRDKMRRERDSHYSTIQYNLVQNDQKNSVEYYTMVSHKIVRQQIIVEKQFNLKHTVGARHPLFYLMLITTANNNRHNNY